MGRLKKNEEEKKIKISISVDRQYFRALKKDKLVPSKFFNKALKDFYEKKKM